MAAFAVFCHVLLLVLTAAALPHRRLIPPLRRRRLLRDDAAILMVLGASAIFHAVTAGPNDDTHALAAAGFLIWVAGFALLLLARPLSTRGRCTYTFCGSARASSRWGLVLARRKLLC